MIRCILTDIEGTTSSIEFVHKVLFPYARSHLLSFLQSSDDPEVSALCRRLWEEELDGKEGTEVDLEAVAVRLQDYIDRDVKHPILKALQGKIWREGYESEAYFGHVYPEVKSALEHWKKKGLKLAVYSSGSVEAQKLLFRHSEAGDLTKLFEEYFDTAVGHKRETASYSAIAKALNLEPSSILFLSDIKEELDAAAEAKLQVCQLMRDPLPAAGKHSVARDFNEVVMRFAL